MYIVVIQIKINQKFYLNHSIASTHTSFKSDGADMKSVVDDAMDGAAKSLRFSVMMHAAGDTDRTSAWLEAHHFVNVNRPSHNNMDNFTKNDYRIINSIFNLSW